MKEWQRENELKLQLLEALVRSQQALGKLAECAAACSGELSGTDRDLVRELGLLGNYQLALSQKVLGIRLREVKVSRHPAPPWLAAGPLGECEPAVDRWT